MRGVRVDGNGPPLKGLTEINHNGMRSEQNGVRDGVNGDGHGLSEEDESRINEDTEDRNDMRRDLMQVQAVLHTQQQQPQGPVVRWERFLPLRSLKVLLVENDDSTRHVVSALLRNCSYEVTAVANGVEAWKILEDLTNHIDLVLTEVAMPYMSGIGLLSKVMNHKTRKNVPLIMMSSNDSMGVVFKCLSNGAVDFLVKPIRKNELKNLWQHVWRKCHSSSGSGSESGIRTEKSTKSNKSIEGSENNSDSNDEGENGSIGLNTRDGSDNGSGTQSSWSKRAIEVESPQPMLPWNELPEPPDSTCAQVIHSRPEAQRANWVPTIATREYQDEEDDQENVPMGKDLQIGVPRSPDLQLNGPISKALDGDASAKKGKLVNVDSSKDDEKLIGKLELNKTRKNELKDKDNGHVAAITIKDNDLMEITGNDVPTDPSKMTNTKEIATYNSKEMPSLELSLKQHREVGETGTTVQERNVLRHSDHLSAFSRYGTTSTANQAPTGNVGSCSPVNNSSEAAKTESLQNLRSNSSSMPNQRSNGSSNNNDMGSSTNNIFVKAEAFTDKPINKSSAVNAHPCSAFQPVQHGQNSSLPGKDSLPSRKTVADAPHGSGPYMLGTLTDGNTNYGSASGSNNASNGHNGSSGQNESNTAVIAEETNMATEDGIAGKCTVGGESGSGSRSGVDQCRQAQREAALNKFRVSHFQVRYQSRKRLAEQRPRIRGQFVSQSSDKTKTKDTNC
nr:two-component response regulator-like PRR37 isoform X1 [Ipomoea batatas]